MQQDRCKEPSYCFFLQIIQTHPFQLNHAFQFVVYCAHGRGDKVMNLIQVMISKFLVLVYTLYCIVLFV